MARLAPTKLQLYAMSLALRQINDNHGVISNADCYPARVHDRLDEHR